MGYLFQKEKKQKRQIQDRFRKQIIMKVASSLTGICFNYIIIFPIKIKTEFLLYIFMPSLLSPIIKFTNMFTKTLILSLLLALSLSQTTTIDWQDQANWEGVCTTGTKQSPIDIDPSIAKYCMTSDFNFVHFACEETNFEQGTGQTGHVEAIDAAYFMTDANVDGQHYKTITATEQFHFHSPSEHTIKGKHYDLQMHIVSFPIDQALWNGVIEESGVETMTSYTNDLLKEKFSAINEDVVDTTAFVVGYLFEIDANAESDNLIIDENGMINLNNLLSCTTEGFFYRYSGSLTTPPCTEGVQWLVARRAIKISQTEFDKIKEKIEDNNNRDVQDLNGRTVRFSGTPCYKSQVQ